ncbi:hypothetical protein HDU67_002826 [Dinochytrium kinnereticum]|nr:hypothetical protein HDU67_002826 [Dinochytrium kinnereticum]
MADDDVRRIETSINEKVLSREGLIQDLLAFHLWQYPHSAQPSGAVAHSKANGNNAAPSTDEQLQEAKALLERYSSLLRKETN